MILRNWKCGDSFGQEEQDQLISHRREPFIDGFQSASFAPTARLLCENGRPALHDGKRLLSWKFRERDAMASEVSMKLVKQFDVDVSACV
ncbi:MAG: hypothetical protein R3C03_03295 [Pirellulaceae bacterium]